MKTLWIALVGTAAVLNSSVCLAQSGNMMGGGGMGGYGWMGGYGSPWLTILLVIVIVGLIIWVVSQNRK